MKGQILDHRGDPMRFQSQRLLEGANPSITLPYWRQHFRDITDEVSVYEWQTVVAASKKLYANLGPAKGAIADKAMYAVGRAWRPQFKGEDQAWGEAATEWLAEQWYPIADVRGEAFDFVTDLFLASISVDRDGDIFVLLTESVDGWPAIQLIPGHRVGCRDSKTTVDSGPYKGLKIQNGVILNPRGRAVAYRVLGDKQDGTQDRDISARAMYHLFEPEWYDQARGFPGFTHAVNDLRSLMTTQGYEERAAMIASEIGLIETNPMGAPDMSDPAFALTSPDVNPPRPSNGLITNELEGGGYRYFQAGTGSNIATLKSDRPGQSWESFMNRLIRNSCVGFGWPYELAWDLKEVGGATARLVVAKAMRAVEDRQDLLRPCAKRAIGYAVSKAMQRGILARNEEWWKWDFSMPARMTVDYGRDSKSDREDLAAGVTTLTDHLAERGIKLEDHLAKLKRERAMMEEAGVRIDQDSGNPEGKTDAGVSAIAEAKAFLDSVGVAVRAGTLTPDIGVEKYVRNTLGLGDLPGEVAKVWKDEPTRRPITLAVESSQEPAAPPANPDEEDEP